jgi:hypothetical protein
LRRNKALLAERAALLPERVQRFGSIFQYQEPERSREVASLASMQANKVKTEKVYAALDEAQAASIKAIEEILDWGQANQAVLKIKDNQLVGRKARRQQARLQELLAKASGGIGQRTGRAQGCCHRSGGSAEVDGPIL